MQGPTDPSSWIEQFPNLPHEPQDLDLLRKQLAMTPAERFDFLRRSARFFEMLRRAKRLGPLIDPLVTTRT